MTHRDKFEQLSQQYLSLSRESRGVARQFMASKCKDAADALGVEYARLVSEGARVEGEMLAVVDEALPDD